MGGWEVKDLFKLAVELYRSNEMELYDLQTIFLERNSNIYYTRKDGKRICLDRKWNYEGKDVELRFRLCIMELLLDKQKEEVLQHVLDIPLDISKDNLSAVFSVLYKIVMKQKMFDERILEMCKIYFNLSFLRPILSKILTLFSLDRMDLVLKVFGIEANMLGPWQLERVMRSDCPQRALKALFATINEKSFKQTKRILKSMDARQFVYLPEEFTNMGYIHLRELFNGMPTPKSYAIGGYLSKYSVARLFLPLKIDLDERYFVHKDIEVRVEAFRHIKDVTDVKTFFRFNQFIYNKSSLELLIKYFSSFVKNGEEELRTLYPELIVPMIQSNNSSRRLLGYALMDRLSSENIITIYDHRYLLFDQNHEIRKIVDKYNRNAVISQDYLIEKMRSNKYHEICSTVEYINKNLCDRLLNKLRVMFSDAMRYFRDKGAPVYGYIQLFTKDKKYDISSEVDVVYNFCFRSLTNTSDFYEEDAILHWRNLRECCFHYYIKILEGNKDPLNKLLQMLLNVNHLGIISLTFKYLNQIFERVEFSDEEILMMIDACFKRIEICSLTFRKSGGISLLLTGILKKKPKLSVFIFDKLYRYIDEKKHMELHSLNILSRLLDVPRVQLPSSIINLFCLAFNCNRSPCWSVKNVGTEIFSKLIKRLFSKELKYIDDCFLTYIGLRKLFYEQLELSCLDGCNTTIMLILHTYERIKKLEEKELAMVKNCSSKSGLVALKARKVINRTYHTRKATKMAIRFDEGLEEGEVLARLLILLDSEQDEEREMATSYINDVLNYPISSQEYLRHILIKRICEINYNETAIKLLREYSSIFEISSNEFFDNSPANERFDLDYNLYLFDIYKTR